MADQSKGKIWNFDWFFCITIWNRINSFTYWIFKYNFYLILVLFLSKKTQQFSFQKKSIFVFWTKIVSLDCLIKLKDTKPLASKTKISLVKKVPGHKKRECSFRKNFNPLCKVVASSEVISNSPWFASENFVWKKSGTTYAQRAGTLLKDLPWGVS